MILDLSTETVAAESLDQNYKPISHHQSWLQARRFRLLVWAVEAQRRQRHVAGFWPDVKTNLSAIQRMPNCSVRVFWYIPNANSHHLSHILNDQMSIFTDKLLDLCDILKNCTGQGPSSVVVVISWCSIGLEWRMSHKYMCPTKKLVTKYLLNLCQSFCCSLSKISTNWMRTR